MTTARQILKAATPEIVKQLDKAGRRVFTQKDMDSLLRQLREDWGLPETFGRSALVTFLSRHKLKLAELVSDVYPSVSRYVWGPASIFELAVSVRPKAYLSHGSAVFLHALTEELPKAIYVNVEQRAKPASTGDLSQERLSAAFRRPQRASQYVLRHKEHRVTVLAGKATDRLEVAPMKGPAGEMVPVTKLERTLIDITVRPAYAGGVYKVLEAFHVARERVSVAVLLATLRKLDYMYPYHQSLGFYMERAGYSREALEPLRKMPISFDFYLAHGMRERSFDPYWRLFFPVGL